MGDILTTVSTENNSNSTNLGLEATLQTPSDGDKGQKALSLSGTASLESSAVNQFSLLGNCDLERGNWESYNESSNSYSAGLSWTRRLPYDQRFVLAPQIRLTDTNSQELEDGETSYYSDRLYAGGIMAEYGMGRYRLSARPMLSYSTAKEAWDSMDLRLRARTKIKPKELGLLGLPLRAINIAGLNLDASYRYRLRFNRDDRQSYEGLVGVSWSLFEDLSLNVGGYLHYDREEGFKFSPSLGLTAQPFEWLQMSFTLFYDNAYYPNTL